MSNNVRLYFRREGTDDYRNVAWFKIKGGDTYWGPSEGTLDVTSVTNPDNNTTMNLTFPDGWQDMEPVHAKRTYHESGVMHTDAGGTKAAVNRDIWLGRPDEMTGPVLLEVYLSKPPADYRPYKRKLDRDQSNVAVLTVPNERWNNPHYLEFHLAPIGEWVWPPPVLKTPEDFADEPWIVRFEPDSDRVLAIRCFASETQEHPMPGYSILPGPAYRSPDSSAPPL